MAWVPYRRSDHHVAEMFLNETLGSNQLVCFHSSENLKENLRETDKLYRESHKMNRTGAAINQLSNHLFYSSENLTKISRRI